MNDYEFHYILVDETVVSPPPEGDWSGHEPLDHVPYPGSNRYWQPGAWRDSDTFRAGRPGSGTLSYLHGEDMSLCRGAHRVTDESRDRRILRNRPATTVILPGPPPTITRRWDAGMELLMSLPEALAAHSGDSGFDRSAFAENWSLLSQAPPPTQAPPRTPSPELLPAAEETPPAEQPQNKTPPAEKPRKKSKSKANSSWPEHNHSGYPCPETGVWLPWTPAGNDGPRDPTATSSGSGGPSTASGSFTTGGPSRPAARMTSQEIIAEGDARASAARRALADAAKRAAAASPTPSELR
jgi:hypothetical protein